MMMKILIAVDLKQRDLASASLIGFFLEKLGYEIHFSSIASLWKEEESIKNLDWDVIILPKPIHSPSLIAKCKLQNITTIAVNTEGFCKTTPIVLVEVKLQSQDSRNVGGSPFHG